MDHRALARAMRDREDGALERFQTALTPLIRYIVAPILPDQRDREECLADVVLRAWDTIGRFDPERGTLAAWVTALARNAALNRRRANDRRREGDGLDETLPDAAGGPEESVIRQETARALWDAVGRLDKRDRDLFLRKYYYYQPTAQIAAELGLSLRAVEGKLYRVRKRLQDELGGVYRG